MAKAWVHQCKQIRYYRTNCTLLGKKNWEHTLPIKKCIVIPMDRKNKNISLLPPE